MQIDLTGKRVIVTGASRGIGRAIAAAFAKEGAKVGVCARGEEALQAAAADFRKLGAQDVFAAQVDVLDTEQCRAFVLRTAERWGGIDVLVNNAGQGFGGSLAATSPEDMLAHANLTQVSHYRFAQAVIPHMRKQNWGRIIDINALSGFYSSGIGSGINRAASSALTTGLAQLVARDNILVNALNMGWLDTGQWDRHYKEMMPPSVSRDEFRSKVQDLIPFGRFGQPEEVAGIALFLASDLANYITGASIDVSGGLAGQITHAPKILAAMVAGN